jgi:hypothetical protein
VTTRFLFAALFAGVCSCVGCGSPAPTPVSPPATTKTPAPPVLSNCVLHAGQSDTTQRREKKPGGELGPSRMLEASCSFNAECVARQGEDNPGDGFAYVSCSDGQCSCRLEPLSGAVVEWQFQSACTSPEQARQLLQDQCLKGMDVAE